MTDILDIDNGEFPNSGLDHTLLIWLDRIPDEQGVEQLVVLILDGPGEWFAMIELLDPDYPNLAVTMPQGLYLMHMRFDYDIDAGGDVENARLFLLHHKRLSVPGRRELREMSWSSRKGVMA